MSKKLSLVFVVIGCLFVGWELGRLLFAPQTMDFMAWTALILNGVSAWINALNLAKFRK